LRGGVEQRQSADNRHGQHARANQLRPKRSPGAFDGKNPSRPLIDRSQAARKLLPHPLLATPLKSSVG
jgi:hypothetical protein